MRMLKRNRRIRT